MSRIYTLHDKEEKIVKSHLLGKVCIPLLKSQSPKL